MFDDRLWYDVWERNLTTVERHAIAVAVWRRRAPGDRFEAIVARELARRWRRHTVYLCVLYGLWTLFWGALAVHDLHVGARVGSPLPPWCAAVGVVAIVACVAARGHIGGYLRTVPAPD